MLRVTRVVVPMLTCFICVAAVGAQDAPGFMDERGKYLSAMASTLAKAAQDHGRLRAKQIVDLERAVNEAERKGRDKEVSLLRAMAQRTALDGRIEDLLAEVELERGLLLADPVHITAVTDFRSKAGAISVPDEIVEVGMPAVPALLDGFRNETQPTVRAFIVHGIRVIGYTPGAARMAVPWVARWMAQDPSAKVRSVCADTLGTIADGSDPLVLARLVAACEDSDAGVRRWAITSYAKLAPKGGQRLEFLTRMASDPDEKVAAAAKEGLQ